MNLNGSRSMPPQRKTIRILLTTVLTLLMGLLVLQAVAYGLTFALDPEAGVHEFASKPADGGDELAVALVGMVGVGMLGTAALLVLSAILVWRSNPAGTSIAMITGGVYVLAGLCAHRAAWEWDAWFYGLTGAALVILSAAVRLSLGRSH